jgi:hypothetical protein
MIKKLSVICVFCGLFFSLWASEPADPAVPTEVTPPAEVTAATEPAGTSEVAAEPTVAPGLAAEPAPPAETPAAPDDTPEVPAGGKIIEFYPEPESLVIVPDSTKPVTPAAKTPTAEKPAATGTTVKTGTTTTTPAVTKTDTKTAEKPGDKTAASATDSTTAKAEAEILPGIWESEAVAPSIPAVTAAAAKSTSAPTRSIGMFVGQTLEVWYPATGWVFLGDASAQNGLGYQTRKMDKSDTLFTFKAVKDGNYILEFSRYDVLTDSFAQDSLAVAVSPSTSGMVKKDKVRAPDYRSLDVTSAVTTTVASDTPAASPAVSTVSSSGAPASASAVQSASNASSSAATAALSGDPLADMLDKAKKAVAAGDAPTALSLLDSFLSLATSSIDEGLYLRGQAYELNGASRNVKKALESYEALVASWPESIRWKDADARVRYIQQFYLRVR